VRSIRGPHTLSGWVGYQVWLPIFSGAWRRRRRLDRGRKSVLLVVLRQVGPSYTVFGQGYVHLDCTLYNFLKWMTSSCHGPAIVYHVSVYRGETGELLTDAVVFIHAHVSRVSASPGS
jgi:hypothetical protein